MNEKFLKVMFVTYKMSDGGAERVISVLANQMVKITGIKVAVFIYQRTKNEYKLDSRVEIFTMPKTYSEQKGTAVTRMGQRILRIRRAMNDFQPDCIIPFLSTMVIETYISTFGRNISVVATVRNKPETDNKFRTFIRDYVYSHCSAVYMQTEAQKKFFSKKIQEKTFVLMNPVSEDFLLLERTPRKQIRSFVTLGRLTAQKNHILLIEAFSAAHEVYSDISLKIYGQGEEEKRLKNRIQELNAGNYIALPGRATNATVALSEADAFILSSNYEGMPNALMEAMAAGVPCISTNCPTGPRELLGRRQERGLLIPVQDKETMVTAIISMVEDANKANRMAAAAAQYAVEKYSPTGIAETLIKEIEKILKKEL